MGGAKKGPASAYVSVVPDATLVFFGPFTQPKLTSVRLANISPHRVAFKFQTDVPLLYRVPSHLPPEDGGEAVVDAGDAEDGLP